MGPRRGRRGGGKKDAAGDNEPETNDKPEVEEGSASPTRTEDAAPAATAAAPVAPAVAATDAPAEDKAAAEKAAADKAAAEKAAADKAAADKAAAEKAAAGHPEPLRDVPNDTTPNKALLARPADDASPTYTDDFASDSSRGSSPKQSGRRSPSSSSRSSRSRSPSSSRLETAKSPSPSPARQAKSVKATAAAKQPTKSTRSETKLAPIKAAARDTAPGTQPRADQPAEAAASPTRRNEVALDIGERVKKLPRIYGRAVRHGNFMPPLQKKPHKTAGGSVARASTTPSPRSSGVPKSLAEMTDEELAAALRRQLAESKQVPRLARKKTLPPLHPPTRVVDVVDISDCGATVMIEKELPTMEVTLHISSDGGKTFAKCLQTAGKFAQLVSLRPATTYHVYAQAATGGAGGGGDGHPKLSIVHFATHHARNDRRSVSEPVKTVGAARFAKELSSFFGQSKLLPKKSPYQ